VHKNTPTPYRGSKGLAKTRGPVLDRLGGVEVGSELSDEHGYELGHAVGNEHVVQPAVQRHHALVRENDAQHLRECGGSEQIWGNDGGWYI